MLEIRTTLLDRIAAYRAAKGLSETAFGRAAVADGSFIRRLRTYKGVTLTVIERAVKYMADNPPPDAVAPVADKTLRQAQGEGAQGEDVGGDAVEEGRAA